MQFIGVGPCYLDIILSVSHFPSEDDKVHACVTDRRWGGNCLNAIKIIRQLLDGHTKDTDIDLNLLAVLPRKSSSLVDEIRQLVGPNINIDTCVFREENIDPAISYVIKSLMSTSRTIISHNPLLDMTFNEFRRIAESFRKTNTWYHFEGHIPDTVRDCIRYLRKSSPGSKISVEIERPATKGLQELVTEADVIFYSGTWARGNGYENAETCLRAQAKHASRATLLCCTWGQQGASALNPVTMEYCYTPAYSLSGPPVDTLGAGDTFIAGILYSCLARDDEWTLMQKLEFANEIAGRKVAQEGFAGLAPLMQHLL